MRQAAAQERDGFVKRLSDQRILKSSNFRMAMEQHPHSKPASHEPFLPDLHDRDTISAPDDLPFDSLLSNEDKAEDVLHPRDASSAPVIPQVGNIGRLEILEQAVQNLRREVEKREKSKRKRYKTMTRKLLRTPVKMLRTSGMVDTLWGKRGIAVPEKRSWCVFSLMIGNDTTNTLRSSRSDVLDMRIQTVTGGTPLSKSKALGLPVEQTH
ncbi:hypothetical protein FB567DRAFT_529232 [Paraphoma chrysanthemicola]|uniref:Uncharacterized protein n=1 Tax=Paraphoma chrysanthemicola TaxID=798071 RepID=A0A8K0R5Z3_9PLEO|nr:hypothetical protein FB567DRAFT_529232 [Paraphoma chrysanthemicola]